MCDEMILLPSSRRVTPRCSGPGLALLAPAANRERWAATKSGLEGEGRMSDINRSGLAIQGRIVEGREAKPTCRLMQSTRIAFALNLKIAKALGLDIPPLLLGIAVSGREKTSENTVYVSYTLFALWEIKLRITL